MTLIKWEVMRVQRLALLLAIPSLLAQDPIPADDSDVISIHAPQQLPTRRLSNFGSGLPIWGYQIVSPVNGLAYKGYMVGTPPFIRDSKTTTIPVILIPF